VDQEETPSSTAAPAAAPMRASQLCFEPPGRVVMIGAGQLARMTHQAAIDYGLDFHVLAGAPDEPAAAAGAPFTLGDHASFDDLLRAAGHGDVVTFDHELIPQDLLRRLEAAGHRVRPGAETLAFAQDKLHSRRQLAALESPRVPLPAFTAVRRLADVDAFAAEHGWPLVLKARGGGYDGRGVHLLASRRDAEALLGDTDGSAEPSWVLEEHLDLAAELAVLLARRPSGELATYPPIETHQENGMCHELVMPARLPAAVASEAVRLAEAIAVHIGTTGLCAVELFWTTDGRLLLNELALRPHNSGHATIEGCATSQFHQHLRAVLDWPLGSTALVRPAAMVNLVGGAGPSELASRLPRALAVPGAHVHLYGKAPRPGRKLGHVTALGPDVDEALDAARAAASLLSAP